ncbi:MAG: methyltransferase domain-containing protein [Pyrinomonadaceae bacterium]|nr:methyltransferase domain-containing protein [Pyrinomonadaceae bacterium]
MIYDDHAKRYDKIMAPLERAFLSRWRKDTLSHLPKNARILEVGAGTGLNFVHYPDSAHAVASELAIQMIEIAKEKRSPISLLQADAEMLPFVDGYFDAAFATLVFCSIPDPEKAFKELKRVLKDDGKVILLEHVRPTGMLGYLFDVLNVFTVALMEDHFNRETAKIADAAGLKVVEVKTKALGIVNLIICEV